MLQAPFPWFGGKRRVAHVVWGFFGEVPNYVEPFYGSGAVLLNRPHRARCETVNDIDCYLSNFWRAVQWDPEQVAYWADWPVNEADLHARHLWLVNEYGEGFRDLMRADPWFYDPLIAGWWVWGISQWIGSGWCAKPEWEGRVLADRASRGIHTHRYQQRPMLHSACGVHSQKVAGRLPDLGGNSGAYGKGIHASARFSRTAGQNIWLKRPNLKRGGNGVQRVNLVPEKRLILKGGAVGVHQKFLLAGGGVAGGTHGNHGPEAPCYSRKRPSQQLPMLSGDSGASGRGVISKTISSNLTEYMFALADRLRRVRVCCGDWKRILGPSPTTCIGTTAVFLDPPYSKEAGRDVVYNNDHLSVAHDVREWAIEHGDDTKLRIALCGYAGEHKLPRGWTEVPWKTNGGYGNQAKGRGFANAHRERIWFSPHCLKDGKEINPRQKHTGKMPVAL